MEETVEYKEEYLEKSRWIKAKKWVKDKVDKTMTFFTENPMLVMPILSGVGMLIGGAVKIATSGGNTRYEACLVEDDVTGEELLTKHPLTNDEILELGERMIDGQPKGAALDDMGLLRNERRRR